MNLINALQTKDTVTTNGMVTNSTSLSACVDMFFNIGALRGKDVNTIQNLFVKAYAEDKLIATKLLFWSRDVRGGSGERQIFRDIIKYLATSRNKNVVAENIGLIPFFGRWDDLLVLIGTPLENDALSLIKEGLADSHTCPLVAKWMPRPNVKGGAKKVWAHTLRKFLGQTPKEYRKMLVEGSNTVEQAMCAKDWSRIEYSKIPSKAMSDYMKAFARNDKDRFTQYIESLEKGETKINAGAVYPYDIVKNMKNGNSRGADAQWNALPNYMEGNTERVLPVVDVSGSMGSAAGGNPSLTCMDIAVSLGLYISERNVGPFKDAFVTFSESPKVQVLKGTLTERHNQLRRADWGYNTNLQKVFEVVLKKAVDNSVSQEDMPSMIIILSDMQFDTGTGNSWNDTAQELIERKYSEAGYEVPKVVYWNLNSHGDSPVTFNKQGTALVSGFSPSLLTSLLSGGSITPETMMLKVVNSERYSRIV
jgi:hypothetical protein